MKIKAYSSFITDNSSECEAKCFYLKTAQNKEFQSQALEKKAKIISVKQAKELLNIDENIKIIGITGTNGKTSTAAMMSFFLESLGYKVFLCGTRGAFIGDKLIDEKGLTTSPILKTLSYLKKASDEKCSFFIMEVSSHALVQNRIEGLKFSAKIYTNLSQDHLDFHQNFENYQKAKESFFTDKSLKFINTDAIKIAYNPQNALLYGLDKKAHYCLSSYDLENGIKAELHHENKVIHINSKLVGLFNLYNLTAAISCVNELVKPDTKELEKAISNFQGVSGRLESVAKGIIVDFAHTPDGIEKVLQALKYKPLIVLFGAGGDRDKAKRPLMAKKAFAYAKILIITSDNPRSEQPSAIINECLSGIEQSQNVFCIEDRKEAIKKALELKEKDDFVVILGKGDEEYQEIKGVKYPFSDKAVVQEILKNKSI